jgi:hypothetical protein
MAMAVTSKSHQEGLNPTSPSDPDLIESKPSEMSAVSGALITTGLYQPLPRRAAFQK